MDDTPYYLTVQDLHNRLCCLQAEFDAFRKSTHAQFARDTELRMQSSAQAEWKIRDLTARVKALEPVVTQEVI